MIESELSYVLVVGVGGMNTMPSSRWKGIAADTVEVDVVAIFIFRMDLKLEYNTTLHNIQKRMSMVQNFVHNE